MDRSISNSRPWMPYCSDVAHELPGEIVHRREDAPRHDIAVNLAWGLAGKEIQQKGDKLFTRVPTTLC